jgi:Flp pilus assembly protein TadB
MAASAYPLVAIVLGALAGAGVFLFVVAVRGVPVTEASANRSKNLEQRIRELWSVRGLVALLLGALALLVTRWLVAGVGVAVLAYAWRGIGGAAGERRAMDRLEALATWTESLRDTIAGAVGLEQGIPSSLRVAGPSLRGPLERLVDRLHTRMPLGEALRRFADDIDDPSADLIIAALIINASLRGPGLRDLLSSLAGAVREELDMRRKVSAERKSTRRSVQIVIGVSVGLAVLLAVIDHGFLTPYDSVLGQVVLAAVAAIYAGGILWLRRLATFETPQRLLTAIPGGRSGPVGRAGTAGRPEAAR